jgi:site-specific recombinase XerD
VADYMVFMNFYDKRDVALDFRIENGLAKLPSFCRMFFISKSNIYYKTTLEKYMYTCGSFFNFISQIFEKQISELSLTDFNNIKTAHIIMYLKTVNGANYRIGELNIFFSFYAKNNFIKCNPAQYIERPKVIDKPITRLTQEEMSKILSLVNNLRDRTILTMFLSTGMRISEVVGLDYKNIDIENKCITAIRSKSRKLETL